MFDFCSLSYIIKHYYGSGDATLALCFIGLRIHVSRAVKDALTTATGFEIESRGLTKVKL